MTFPLTLATDLYRRKINLDPQIVLEIDGVSTIFGTGTINEYVRIGAENLLIGSYLGEPWYIGGVIPKNDQGSYISTGGAGGGTTTRIVAQLEPDKGIGQSVTQMTVTLIDKNEEVSELISPGFIVSEILAKKCNVKIGFQSLAYPDDYITIFRGIIEDITSGPGYVTFSLSSTEQKKRQTLFPKFTAKLQSAISDSGSVSTITLDDTSGFFTPINGPTGSPDTNISYYVKIGDEYFSYTGKTLTTLTGVTRNPSPFNFGQQAHSIDDDVSSMVRIQGNGLEIARKLMLSGWAGPYLTGVQTTHFNYISPILNIPNAIFFFGVDVSDKYGIFPGDFITTSGASNGANNVTLKEILEVTKVNDGSYIVVDGVTFVDETDSNATIAFRSKWDVFPDGCKMTADDVDLYEFNYLYRLFLSSFDFDFRIDSGIEGKSFIEEQIFRPMSAFSIQRKGRTSVGYHIGPIPGANLLTLSQDNIENADKLKIRRSISKNYYNTVIVNFDRDINSGRFLSIKKTEDSTSISDFGVGRRAIQIDSQGLRSEIAAEAQVLQASNRFLNRYKRGAEFIDTVEVRFGDAFNAEIGDIILLDTGSLSVTNIEEGTRSGTIRIFQILNKTLDVKAGKVSFNLVDTNFSTSSRYCLISPASKIRPGASPTVITIKDSFESVFGSNEYLKWQRFGEIEVVVRSPDSVTRYDSSTITSIGGNTVTLATALSFTPQENDIMEFYFYNNSTDQQKLAYGYMRDVGPFDDGKDLYRML